MPNKQSTTMANPTPTMTDLSTFFLDFLTRKRHTLLALSLVLIGAVSLMGCNKKDDGPAPTYEPEVKIPARTGGFISLRINGAMRNGTPLNESLNLTQYYEDGDVNIIVDSSVSPAVRVVYIYRTDTVSGSKMILRFGVRHWSDTGVVARNKSANIQYYFPNRESSSKLFEGSVPNSNLADAIMRVNRIYFQENGGRLLRVRGEYLMSPISNSAAGTLVNGSFDIPLDTLVAW